jgi:hypothetical protein
MTEEDELLAQIGDLAGTCPTTTALALKSNSPAGQINRRKNRNVPLQTRFQTSPTSPPHKIRSSYPHGHRSHPYARGRGHGFPNKSLLTNRHGKHEQVYTISSTPERFEMSSDENSNPTQAGIQKYGNATRAWISEDVLRQKIERKKRLETNTDIQETGFIPSKPVSHQGSGYSTPVNYITVDGIRFRLSADGSKLLRDIGMNIPARDHAEHAQPSIDSSTAATPKVATVSGVVFKRTKNGNLIRAEAVQKGLVSRQWV